MDATGGRGVVWLSKNKLGVDSLVPLAGIEPALLAELDFESSASTNSATGACRAWPKGRGREAGGI
jgi:hypothetical protein